jgi:hypothetical protein
MLPFASMKNLYDGLLADADAAAARGRALDDAIGKIQADASLSPQWKTDQIAELRKAALDAIREKVKTFDERVAVMESQKRFWSNTEFVVSAVLYFNDSETNDAIIAARHLAECKAMPSYLLQLTADSAKQEKNYPLLTQCWLAGQGRSGEGWRGVDFSGVVLPQQKQVLDMIEQAKGIAWAAHSTLSVASGGTLTGADKLALARVEQARKGGAPTTHNSQGRAAPKAR